MFTAVVVPPGGTPLELTPLVDSVTFSTLAIGGFGSCSLSVPLDQVTGGAKRVPKLSHLTLYHGSHVLWEGRIEDHSADYIAGTLGLTCFGYQRVLENSVKRIWIQRTIPWQLVSGLAGTPFTFKSAVWAWTTVGRFDETDLTRSGLQFSAQTGLSGSAGWAHGAWYWTDAPMWAIVLRHKRTSSDPASISVYDSPDGGTWTARYSGSANYESYTTVGVQLGSTARFIRIIAAFEINLSGANVVAQVDDMRILGMSQWEDGSGGYYAHTLLNDLLAQFPELSVGTIDVDTSFSIPQLSRAQRDRGLSVVQEIASYFQRRWGVWEDRKFHWTAVDLDQPHWVLNLSQLTACNITSSVDNVARTIYLTYGNVANGLPEEVSVTSTDRRNPYVRSGVDKDEVLSAPVGMTGASAQQLVNRLASDHGSLPATRGSVRLPADALVENLVGQAMPACYIRAGENIVIPELPKDDYLIPGRDGQTLFHVTGSTTDMTENRQTTLELEGYSRSSDVIMARLSAATRTLTG